MPPARNTELRKLRKQLSALTSAVERLDLPQPEKQLSTQSPASSGCSCNRPVVRVQRIAVIPSVRPPQINPGAVTANRANVQALWNLLQRNNRQ